jgi:hypothetical protein
MILADKLLSMQRQCKFVAIAVAIGLCSVLAPWAIVSALGTDVDINSYHKWRIPALVAFVAISAAMYLLLLLVFNDKKSGK